MKPQCAQLYNALLRRPLTSLEIWRQLGISRAAARVYDLRGELPAEGKTITTELVLVDGRDKKPARVARYAVIPHTPQGDLWAPHCEGVRK